MANRSVAAGIGLAGVLAHCGGDPLGAAKVLAAAIASAPDAAEPYAALAELWRTRAPELRAGLAADGGTLDAVNAQAYFFFLDGDMDNAVMALGSVTGVRPDVAWGAAPWFADARFLGAVSAPALAEACLRTLDHGHDLDSDAMRERFTPWFHALDVVSGRDPVPESLAAMARLPRACGRYGLSFVLCDRADAAGPDMWTAVARAATWWQLGDLDEAATAFEDALRLDPANWSLHLDLADVRAAQGDFGAAADLAAQGLEHAPDELSLRAASAAYRTRHLGSADDLRALTDLAPQLGNSVYRGQLIDHACADAERAGLPAALVAEALRVRAG